ncbi:MAG: hypothetical protein ALECFALPRED_005941 [Alectoria fallacina]|uniref:Uncharacterized protein n=1 Tax=Alectoria fallacina TaxID=1903189 RepID=A0A8H3G295_9LECA|nr:MAG: hypothetical protein ALECFALPRED_005941 [Alectoria fallacina]
MPAKTPSGMQWTLRFKQHKTTILLFVQQSQSFNSIKRDLLDAIKATGINDINGNALASDPEDIEFGVPRDKNDISRGWVALKIPEVENGDTNGKGVKKGSILNESPLGAGLKDGAMLAFKFTKGVEEDGMDVDDEWDVIIPSYDDEAGSQSQGHV